MMTRHLNKKALQLSYFTVAYNVLEGVAAVIAGIMTGSIALAGFGFDSFIESISGGVMIWRFTQHTVSEEEEEKIEKKASKLVGYSFFILGLYILYEAVKGLYLAEEPQASLFGVVIALLSLIIMPTLAYMKHRTGHELKSRSLVADSKQTTLCVLMSVALFIGLGLNFLFGWWWADPIAGIVLALLSFREGYTTLKEESLCDC